MNDEIEIIENVPKIKKKKNYKKIIIIGIISLVFIMLIIILLLMLISKPSNAIVNEKSNQKDNLREILINNYKNEAESYISYLKNAYIAKSQSVINVMDDNVESTTDIYNITIEHKNYYYLCMTLKDLVNEKFLTKTLKDDAGGYIQIWISEKDDEEITFVNVTNGKYFYQGNSVSEEAKEGIEVPSSLTKCPTQAKFQSI